ncbi:XRE family transcriptional regulator [Azorhizophilus paspali]|uniref:XRE family transcriptional regulator n=2 Tax=Azorhizophilus paspali TaxID=69963 RepID=A0ABV6SI89_AZOPA
MSTIGKRIALAREEKGWNQSELARQLGVKPQSVQAWEAGRNVPRPQKMQQMSRLLGKSVGYFMDDANAISNPAEVEPGPPITSPWRAIPIVGTAQMGTEGYWHALESADGYVEMPTRDKHAYALRLKGNSMAPAIKSGWVAVIEPNGLLIPGEYVMVRLVDEECMLKELLYANDVEVSLASVNDAYERRTIPVEQIELIHAVGAVCPPSKVRV